jgi:hypothetical protein
LLATSSEKRSSASPLTHVVEAARTLLSLIPPSFDTHCSS